MKKKVAIILIVAILCLATVLGCVACQDKNPTGDEKQTFDIVMWVSEIEGVADQFQAQVKAFNETNGKYTINATISGVSEGEAATQMIADVETGADIFCFAQDQLSRLVQAGALQYLGTAAADAVKAANDATSVAASTIGDKIYCYPLTSDNGYFMYYDKSVVSEDHIGDLDAIIADCKAKDKLISFNLGGSGWYNASFFFGAGCTSEWTTPDGKTFTGVTDDYNSEKGMIAMKALSAFMNSSVYTDSAETSDFQKGAGVVISGTWGSATAKTALGENLGVAKLPQYTVDGVKYQLGSFSGCKLMGVKPTQNLERAKALQALATYLTNKENQLARFESKGWGPSNIEAQNDPAVKADAILSALIEQNVNAKPQGQIPGGWWDATKTLAAAAKEANGDEAALKVALEAYKASIDTMADPTYVPGKDATLIGSMFGDTGWTKDHEMVKKQGVWETVYPIYLNAGDEFKVRFGKTWDNGEFGDGSGNYVVETAGLYTVKANEETKTIELVPAVLGVVGTFNKWGDTPDTAMEYVDGAMTATVDLEAGAELKVRVNGAWEVNYGNGGDANFVVDAAGSYKVTATFDLTAMTWVVTVVAAE